MPRLARPGAAVRRLAAPLAVAVAVLVPATGTPEAGAGVNARLLPDLVTMRISKPDLVLEAGKLRLSNEIGNRGRGPLEIYPSATSNNCDGDGNASNDRDVSQRMFLDSNGDGVFRRSQDTESDHHRFGCEQGRANDR